MLIIIYIWIKEVFIKIKHKRDQIDSVDKESY